MNRPTYAHIHLPAIAENIVTARKHAPDAFVWAVTKADAYGHGLNAVLPALHGADGIALLELDKAISLREQGEHRPILLLEGPFSFNDALLIIKHNLTPVLHQPDQVKWINEAASVISSPLNIYIKVNTGMNRLGFHPKNISFFVEQLQKPWVKEIVLMTHFANADKAEGLIAPLSRWREISWNKPTSIANSAALLGWSLIHNQTESIGDAVRPGIALYGSSPIKMYTAQALGLQAAMTLKAGIIAIQHIQPEDTVGYGSAFKSSCCMRVGIVACGYADGYPRHAPTGTPVWVKGQITHVLGCVSMDMLAIDLTNHPSVMIGDEVELWGQNIPIDTVAQYAGTIAYELMCGITARVKRVYEPLST